MKTRILVVLALAVLLALLAGTVAAKTIRTPFTGTSSLLTWIWEGRYWEPGPNVFWRDMIPILQLDASDPRISGIVCVIHNGNYRPSPDDPCFGIEGPMFGKIRIEQDGDLDCWNATDGWEGNFVAMRHPDGLETFDMNVKGFGQYEGLQARFHEWSLSCGGDQEALLVEGEILDPDGK
jgi:hypothetical protein